MTETILQVIGYILTIALGGIALWYKSSGTLKEFAAKFILYAEQEYGDLVNAGGKKFNEVVDWLCEGIPVVLRPFMPRKFVERIVQSVFDAMEDYARIQLDPDGFFFPEYGDHEVETGDQAAGNPVPETREAAE